MKYLPSNSDSSILSSLALFLMRLTRFLCPVAAKHSRTFPTVWSPCGPVFKSLSSASTFFCRVEYSIEVYFQTKLNKTQIIFNIMRKL